MVLLSSAESQAQPLDGLFQQSNKQTHHDSLSVPTKSAANAIGEIETKPNFMLGTGNHDYMILLTQGANVDPHLFKRNKSEAAKSSPEGAKSILIEGERDKWSDLDDEEDERIVDAMEQLKETLEENLDMLNTMGECVSTIMAYCENEGSIRALHLQSLSSSRFGQPFQGKRRSKKKKDKYEPTVCRVCNRTFTTRRGYNRHKAIHPKSARVAARAAAAAAAAAQQGFASVSVSVSEDVMDQS